MPAIDGLLGALELLHATPGLALRHPPAGSRDPGRRPSRHEDPYNAFIRVCDVRGAGSGLLAGRTVGLKDNIDVAGIPTSNASATRAFTPARDAVVVERILAAGGRIVGKLNMDDFGAGASGETSAFGPPRNPHDPTRSAGGSSGGSGAALAAGAVDLALGVDQAGSARIPASFCGVVAVKATHGLIPSQGVTHLDHTLDAVCPMASTVEDAALLLEAIAGDDWRDPQWVGGRFLRAGNRTTPETSPGFASEWSWRASTTISAAPTWCRTSGRLPTIWRGQAAGCATCRSRSGLRRCRSPRHCSVTSSAP